MTTTPARYVMDGLVHYIVTELTFADSTQKEIGTVPAGATILKPISGVSVNVAFNAATTNTIDIGTADNDDLYGSALAAGSIAFVPLDEAVSQKVAADTTLYALYEQTGTAATAGSATAVIAYVLGN